VIVQGAMDVEVRKLAAALESPVEERVGGWTFWRGTIGGAPVVVSKTLKGMENAAAATALAIERYHPSAIINQGTAGGHDPALHVSDIVIGLETVNIGSFKTGERKRSEGSAFSAWVPLDLNASEGSAGQEASARRMRRFPADAALLAAAREARRQYARSPVVEGVIASSDIWNSELDRIAWLHDTYGTTVEEMEAASAAQIAAVYGVPFVGIRVVSNNITNGGAHDRTTGEVCQDFVLLTLKTYVAAGVRSQASSPRTAPRRSEAPAFEPLGDLPGGPIESMARCVSADGSVVAGSSRTESGSQAFVWTSGSGMPSLGGVTNRAFAESWATGMSADGATIASDGSILVGWGRNPEPFRLRLSPPASRGGR
jgi:adenosylhomocysteine nucleosidase